MNTLTITKKEGYSIIQLDRGKVNPINQEMVDEITEVFQHAETDNEVKGVILSGKPHYFSAGLDLIELITYDKAQITQFFKTFGALVNQLMRFPKPFITAITGYSPAGGCVLAVASDYRIMAEGERYLIGLNEVAVNIQISQILIEAYSFWMGRGLAYRYILEGKLLNVKEAFESGLVDEVTDLDKVLERAEKRMKHYLMADPNIWKNTKKKLRQDWLLKIEDSNETFLNEVTELWWKPEIRAKMEAYVKSFSSK